MLETRKAIKEDQEEEEDDGDSEKLSWLAPRLMSNAVAEQGGP